MGNSKGIVKRLRIETIDAAKYLFYKLKNIFQKKVVERYEFNDYRKLDNHVHRNMQIRFILGDLKIR